VGKNTTATTRTPRFLPGQRVTVRSAEEILRTLDGHAELAAMPFMPEMLRQVGATLRVYKVASKACDTLTSTGMRRMEDAVHLDGVRCDGSGHGGCQADCLVYWKNSWLRPADNPNDDAPTSPREPDTSPAMAKLHSLIAAAARREPDDDGAERYSCQATELLRASGGPLPVRHLGQYVADVRVGNAGVAASARALAVGIFNRYQDRSQRVLPRWLVFRGGAAWGFLKGTQTTTPTARTDLQPGELVRIKSKKEIMGTLNRDLLNRGLGFDPEMARHCGKVARVARRVDLILDEKTGRMLRMKNPCIVLEGIVCEGAHNANCPRAIPQYWREIWLERVDPPR
jgi:hypothetical protein